MVHCYAEDHAEIFAHSSLQPCQDKIPGQAYRPCGWDHWPLSYTAWHLAKWALTIAVTDGGTKANIPSWNAWIAAHGRRQCYADKKAAGLLGWFIVTHRVSFEWLSSILSIIASDYRFAAKFKLPAAPSCWTRPRYTGYNSYGHILSARHMRAGHLFASWIELAFIRLSLKWIIGCEPADCT